MASRKTYFGIGWKDPDNPESGPVGAGKNDPADRSSPTIVDDEKVAEGLRQLRSWYQGDTQQDQSGPTAAPERTPANTIGGPQARPTAVGHATGPPPSAATQRPFAPDPMRATMYGHDVHQFDLDAPPAGGQPQATPPASSTALVLANPGTRQQQDLFRNAAAVPMPAPLAQSDSFQLSGLGGGEAQRLQRPAGVRRSSYDVRPKTRVPVASRVMFAIGIASLLIAIGIWFVSGSGSETPAAQQPPAPAAVPSIQPAVPPTPALPSALTPISTPTPPATPPTPAAHPAAGTDSAPKTTRPTTSSPAPVPIPAVTAPKSERPRPPATPAALKSPRRTREVKVEDIKLVGDSEDATKPRAEAPAGDTPVKEPLMPVKIAPARETPPPARETPPPAKGKSRAVDSDETMPPSDD